MGCAVGHAAFAYNLLLIFKARFCNSPVGGIGYPVLIGSSIEHVSEGGRGTAMGLHQLVNAIGMSVGPWLYGILAEVLGIRPMYAWTAVAYVGFWIIDARRFRLRFL